jgi:hypothetical protein
VPPTDRGLLARLDALVELAADRHGLALLPGGRLAAAEARAAARAAGLTPTTRGTSSGGASAARGPAAAPALAQRDAVELLRAGLVYAAWCQQVTLTGWPLGGTHRRLRIVA